MKRLASKSAWLAWAALAVSLTILPSVLRAYGDELILCGWDEVFVLNAGAGSSGIATNKVWSWKAATRSDLPEALRERFRTTDECKPVDGGRKILITSSGGGVALVDRATQQTLFHGFVGNAHSAEMLPGDRVAVAGSRHEQGNCVAIFDLRQPGKVISSTHLDSGHGLVWDEARQILWALGYDRLLALRLKSWETANPELETIAEHSLPDDSGHDLVDVPGSNDLIVTTDRHVFLFNRDQRTFRRHPELGDKARVKSVSIHPKTGQIVYVEAEGTNWWAGGFHLLNPAGELRLPGERLYKARWNAGL